MGRPKKIELHGHYESIYLETLAYLQWQSLKAQGMIDQQNFLLQRAEDGKLEPEPPQPYITYRRLQAYSSLYYDGGYANQPYLMMREFDQCVRAENEMETIRAFNARQNASSK